MADQLFADDYLASCYDVWHPRPTRDDYDFYLPRILAARAVLDAGCGTGTLLAEARAAGHRGRLCGLDPAAGMLARARLQRGIEWVLGELRSSVWECQFEMVVMTGHAFQALVTDEDILTSLAAVRRALTCGGRFAFETRNPAARAWELWRAENRVTIIGPDHQEVRITTDLVAPFDGRTVTFTHTFEGRHPSLPQVSQSMLRFLGRDALGELLERSGFRVEEQFGNFAAGPFAMDSPEIITVARPET